MAPPGIAKSRNHTAYTRPKTRVYRVWNHAIVFGVLAAKQRMPRTEYVCPDLRFQAGSGAPLHDQQDLAHVVAGVEVGVCGGDLVQRKALGHEGTDPAVGQHRPHGVADGVHDYGLFLHRAGTQRGGDDGGPLLQQLAKVQFRLRAALQPDHHEASVVGERIDVLLEVFGPDDVEDDVRAFAAVLRAQARREVFLRVVDGDVRPEEGLGC